MCECPVNPIDIKSMAKLGKILSTANVQDCRYPDYPTNWLDVARKMRIGDCVVFRQKNLADNFYGSSRRLGIWLSRYASKGIIAYTRYE